MTQEEYKLLLKEASKRLNGTGFVKKRLKNAYDLDVDEFIYFWWKQLLLIRVVAPLLQVQNCILSNNTKYLKIISNAMCQYMDDGVFLQPEEIYDYLLKEEKTIRKSIILGFLAEIPDSYKILQLLEYGNKEEFISMYCNRSREYLPLTRFCTYRKKLTALPSIEYDTDSKEELEKKLKEIEIHVEKDIVCAKEKFNEEPIIIEFIEKYKELIHEDDELREKKKFELQQIFLVKLLSPTKAKMLTWINSIVESITPYLDYRKQAKNITGSKEGILYLLLDLISFYVYGTFSNSLQAFEKDRIEKILTERGYKELYKLFLYFCKKSGHELFPDYEKVFSFPIYWDEISEESFSEESLKENALIEFAKNNPPIELVPNIKHFRLSPNIEDHIEFIPILLNELKNSNTYKDVKYVDKDTTEEELEFVLGFDVEISLFKKIKWTAKYNNKPSRPKLYRVLYALGYDLSKNDIDKFNDCFEIDDNDNKQSSGFGQADFGSINDPWKTDDQSLEAVLQEALNKYQNIDLFLRVKDRIIRYEEKSM